MSTHSEKRWLIRMAIILILALVISSCQPTPSVPAPTPILGKNTLRLSGFEPSSLDPALAGDAFSAVYIMEIFSGLVTLNPSLQVKADLAEKWDINADGTVYTFHLRKDAKFHDGRPVTAQD